MNTIKKTLLKKIAKVVYTYGKQCANQASQHGFCEVEVPFVFQDNKKIK